MAYRGTKPAMPSAGVVLGWAQIHTIITFTLFIQNCVVCLTLVLDEGLRRLELIYQLTFLLGLFVTREMILIKNFTIL